MLNKRQELPCKVLDLNQTDVFIALEDGSTIDVSTARLSNDVKIGDTVEVPLSIRSSMDSEALLHDKLINEKLVDFF